MESSTKRNREPRRIERMLSVLAVVLGPTSAIASCSLEPMDPSLREEKLTQLACGGRGVGGSIGTGGFGKGGSIGGTFPKGGIGGSGSPTGCPPPDPCTAWSCVDGGCVPTALMQPGQTCIMPDQSRGRCGTFYPDSASTRDGYLVCCVGGCLNERMECIPFADQGDSSCGRVGADCRDCGECASCDNTGSCDPAGNEASCPGGLCNGGTCCTGCIENGMCFNNGPLNCGSNGGTCMTCDDGRHCTNDTCNNGTCQHSNITGTCNDGDACTTNDTCSGSACEGEPKDCDDGNLCTTDDCDSATGCTYAPRSGDCVDGNACTSPDSCASGQCTGPMLNCDDGNQCTTDSCDPMTGCVRTDRAEDANCDDGNACTTGDRCHDHDNDSDTPRRCVPQTGPDCDDGNPCNMDVADCTTNTCTHPAANDDEPCAMGGICVVGQVCSNGTCGGGMPLECDDNSDCTTDSCDPVDGCVRTPANDGDECVDGNQCTTGDACNNGECVGEPVECVALDDCHDIGTCDAESGTCDDPRKRDGAACGTSGMCAGGRCVGDGVVDPTGGTGPGTAGGGPGGGDTGGTGPGAAGEGTGNAGSGGTAGTEDPGPLFQRDPGGCACRVPASAPARPGYLALGLASALAFVMRRRRRAA